MPSEASHCYRLLHLLAGLPPGAPPPSLTPSAVEPGRTPMLPEEPHKGYKEGARRLDVHSDSMSVETELEPKLQRLDRWGAFNSALMPVPAAKARLDSGHETAARQGRQKKASQLALWTGMDGHWHVPRREYISVMGFPHIVQHLIGLLKAPAMTHISPASHHSYKS